MSPKPDHDRSVHRLLEGMRRANKADAVAGEVCLEAGDFAAWADGALPASRRTAVESHLATCARCQAMAAAFVKAEPAPPRSLWSRWQIVVPVLVSAAAAVTFAVSLWLARSSSRPTPSTTIAETETAPVAVPPALVPAPPAVPVQEQPPVQPGSREPAAAAPRAQTAVSSADAKRGVQTQGRPTEPLPTGSAGATAADSTARTTDANAKAVAPPAASSAAPAPKPTRGDFTTDQMLKVPTARDPWQVVNMAPGVVLSGANVGGSASGQQLTVSAFGTSGNVQWNLEGGNSDAVVVAEFGASGQSSSPAMRVAAGAGGGGRGGGRAGAAATREVGDDARQVSSARWRILADGHVDRSTDSGASWMRMSTDPTVFITAGAAPLPTTCWFAGRAGIVLVTTDNEHFTRVDLPDHVDVKSVTALANVVTVVTITGVTYSSADGGKTWQRR